MKRNRASSMSLWSCLPETRSGGDASRGRRRHGGRQAVLQLTHAVVVEGGAVDRSVIGASAADLRHVSLRSRQPPRRDRPEAAGPRHVQTQLLPCGCALVSHDLEHRLTARLFRHHLKADATMRPRTSASRIFERVVELRFRFLTRCPAR